MKHHSKDNLSSMVKLSFRKADRSGDAQLYQFEKLENETLGKSNSMYRLMTKLKLGS